MQMLWSVFDICKITFFINYCVNCEYLYSLYYVYVNDVIHLNSDLTWFATTISTLKNRVIGAFFCSKAYFLERIGFNIDFQYLVNLGNLANHTCFHCFGVTFYCSDCFLFVYILVYSFLFLFTHCYDTFLL